MSFSPPHVLGEDHIHSSKKADKHHWVYLNVVFYKLHLACIAGGSSGWEFPASKVPVQKVLQPLSLSNMKRSEYYSARSQLQTLLVLHNSTAVCSNLQQDFNLTLSKKPDGMAIAK